MNFLTMEYFRAVAAKRNFTKAAEELHITQQTLSAHIASLEKELACQLIIRSTPLELTYAGEVFLRHATSIYENWQSMWNEFNDLTHNQRGKLLVGVDYAKSRTIMPGIIGAFQAQYPNIEVRLTESGNKSLQTSLISKDIDLAVGRIFDTLPNTEILDFYNDETVMLVPVEFAPENAEKSTHLSDVSQFSRCPFVLGGGHDISSEIGKGLIEKSGFQPIVKARSNNLDTLVEFCSKGIGICFCPKSLVRATLSRSQLRRVRVYYFTGASYPIRFAYRKESYQWKIISEFIRIALAEKEKLRL